MGRQIPSQGPWGCNHALRACGRLVPRKSRLLVRSITTTVNMMGMMPD